MANNNISEPINIIKNISENPNFYNYEIELPRNIPVCQAYQNTFNFQVFVYTREERKFITNATHYHNVITQIKHVEVKKINPLLSQLNIPTQLVNYYQNMLKEILIQLQRTYISIKDLFNNFSITLQYNDVGTMFKLVFQLNFHNLSINYDLSVYVIGKLITLNIDGDSYDFKFKNIDDLFALLNFKTCKEKFNISDTQLENLNKTKQVLEVLEEKYKHYKC